MKNEESAAGGKANEELSASPIKNYRIENRGNDKIKNDNWKRFER